MAERHRAWMVEAACSGRGSGQGKMGRMNVTEAREAWLRSPARHDFGADAEDALRDAFAAGWNAARPAIYGVTSGHVTHDRAKRPGELKVTIWGHAEDGREIALVMGEDDAVRLRGNLDRIGIGL